MGTKCWSWLERNALGLDEISDHTGIYVDLYVIPKDIVLYLYPQKMRHNGAMLFGAQRHLLGDFFLAQH